MEMESADVDLDRTRADDPVRVCAECQRAKTIRGVWYLVPGLTVDSPFVCETCFAHRPSVVAFS